jgi:hypothetical protein
VFNNAVGLYASQYPNGYTDAPANIAIYTAAKPRFGRVPVDRQSRAFHLQLTAGDITKKRAERGPDVSVVLYILKGHRQCHHGLQWPGANSAVAQNNPFCWSCEKALASFDVPQRVVVNFSYQLPFDKAASHLPKRLTQGWTFWGIATASSGFPFTVVTPFGSAEYGIDTYAGTTVRPNLVSTPTLKPAGQGPEEQFFSNAVIQDSKTSRRRWPTIRAFTGQFFSVPLATLDGNTVAATPGKPGPQHLPECGLQRFGPFTGEGHQAFRARDDAVPRRVLQHS